MEVLIKGIIFKFDASKLKKGIICINEIEINQYDNGNGYKFISVGGIREYVHRIVGKAFLTNPENKPQINHINGIKDDNRLENLEWCNASENGKHAYKNGLNCISEYQKEQTSKSVSGTKCHFSLLTENDVKDIRIIKKIGLSNLEIGKLFNVHRETIGNIIRGKTWKRTA